MTTTTTTTTHARLLLRAAIRIRIEMEASPATSLQTRAVADTCIETAIDLLLASVLSAVAQQRATGHA